MKILISRSRYYGDYQRIYRVIKSFGADITIISGACRGADTLAVRAIYNKKVSF
jgi:predicted Rossmann fold nucleotide-binding protein DprA/Smf involved in DNA uptake